MPKKRHVGAMYFTGITRIDKGGVALTGNYYVSDEKGEQRTAFVTLRNGSWGGMDLSGIAHAVRFTGDPKDPNRQYLILERNRGLYRYTPPNNVQFERIAESREGFLMDLRRIGEQWYTCGGHHQVYEETGRLWTAMDQGLYLPGEEGEAKLLLSIDGTTRADIYAVGFNGVIFHFNGKIWSQSDSPTNVGLQKVLCVSKDEIYLCGNAMGLYRGNVRRWTPLTEPDEKVTFWDMALFQSKVYVCTKKQLFVIAGDVLEEVEIPVDGPIGFYRMDADSDELWTCGNECILQFDGKRWQQHIFPDNL